MMLKMRKWLMVLLAAIAVLTLALVIFLLKEPTMPGKSPPHRIRQYRNRLGTEKSPYLLQHADNPVDWYPWGAEAFEKARREDKPIFLSIGYSTCHWCHVMEHESFEDPEVAKLMNEVFVSIKVDREERPDIDQVYMTVCQMMTGSGGWPLTIIMTPEKKPFFAGTYIPKTSSFGRIGLMQLIPQIQEKWTNSRDELLSLSSRISTALQRGSPESSLEQPDQSILDLAYRQLLQRFDHQHGGFGSAPKFPTPHNLIFLLRYGKRSGASQALEMVEKTLGSMRAGGMYDHIGFGFHRYSTDSRWLVPHFEKMLYDQALLAMAYTEAYQATGKGQYARTAREIFSYVLRDMTATDGGFYSAEDADSEGEEGKMYLWSLAQIRRTLSGQEADLAVAVFNIEKRGNFVEQATRKRTGTNILHLQKSMQQLALEVGSSEPDLQKRLQAIRQKLFAQREKRVHPHKDDKILTDWNGLMIASLAKAGRVLDEPRYTSQAQRAVDFIFKRMRSDDGRLLHRYRDDQTGLAANIDDYAFLIWGLLEMYETTFEVQHLQRALDLNKQALEYFWDEQNGGFYFTADDGEKLLVRMKESYDGAIPSGNSVAFLNLIRLARLTADTKLEAKAAQIGRAFFQTVSRLPSNHSQLMVGLDFAFGPAYEVVIAGDFQAQDTRQMLRALRSRFIPNKVVVFRPGREKSPAIIKLAPYTEYQKSINGAATAYVCKNYVCKLPTTDTNKMLELLQAK